MKKKTLILGVVTIVALIIGIVIGSYVFPRTQYIEKDMTYRTHSYWSAEHLDQFTITTTFSRILCRQYAGDCYIESIRFSDVARDLETNMPTEWQYKVTCGCFVES